MYLYIENKHFILIEDVYLIIDYADFFKNKENSDDHETKADQVVPF